MSTYSGLAEGYVSNLLHYLPWANMHGWKTKHILICGLFVTLCG